jgi:hypothetical protein
VEQDCDSPYGPVSRELRVTSVLDVSRQIEIARHLDAAILGVDALHRQFLEKEEVLADQISYREIRRNE